MIFIEKMKNFKIYRTKTFLPTVAGNKKKNSAVLMMTPNYESSKKLMTHPMFVNSLRYQSYYLDRDVSYYINSKVIEEVDEQVIIERDEYNQYQNDGIEINGVITETKRSELPDSAFGVPGKRKFPLDTEKHVRSAIKFFNYVDKEDEAELARRIIAAMKKFGIKDVKVGPKNRFSKYYHPKQSTNESLSEELQNGNARILGDLTYYYYGWKYGTIPEDVARKAIFDLRSRNLADTTGESPESVPTPDKFFNSGLVQEGYLKSEEDILWHKKEFNDGEINLCFITGHSGSGKSTLADMNESNDVEIYCLDDVIENWRFTDHELDKYGDLISSFFNIKGKEFRISKEELDEIYKDEKRFNEFGSKLIIKFVDYSIWYSKIHKNKKFIIEGIQLFGFVEPSRVEDFAVYIKGTSALLSWIRATKRNIKSGKGFKDFKSNIKLAYINFLDLYDFEKRIKKWRDFYDKKLVKESGLNDYVDSSIDSSVLVEQVPGALNLGDKLILFNEDAKNDAQLKRLLFRNRLRRRKDVIELYEKVKLDLPFIKYAFPELPKYLKRNLYVDLYYYNSVFFENNTWMLKKGLSLYSDLMFRLIDNPIIKNAGYERRTIFIPVIDWDKNHDGTVWNYRVSLNPLSIMFYMMFNNQGALLKKAFGNHDIIIYTNNKYFKLNFAEIDMRDIKKMSTKFKLFLIKLCKNEEFDAEDVDTTADMVETPDVVQAKVVDKIELAKGVDLTPQVAVAAKKKEAELKSNKNNFASSNKENIPLTNSQEKKVQKDTSKITKDEAEENPIDNATKNAQISQDYKNKLDEKKEKLANAIVNGSTPSAANQQPSEEDTLDSMNDDEIKEILSTLDNEEEGIKVSSGRAARMTQLEKNSLKKEIKGKTVEEILNEESAKEEKTTINVSSPNADEWKDLTFMNFDKNYNIDKDIVASFRKLGRVSRPIMIRDIKVSDNSTSEDWVELYDVDMEDYIGNRFHVKLDIPIMQDNRFRLRGDFKAIQTQMINIPILKTSPDVCQIASNYNKIFVSRFGSIGKSLPDVVRFQKAVNKYEDNKIKFVKGDNHKISSKYYLPMDYLDLSMSFSKIIFNKRTIYFNQDELRKKYDIDPAQGMPYGYDEKTNEVLYFRDNPDNTFIQLLLDDIFTYDSNFEDIFYAMTKGTSCAYSRAKILNIYIPICIICGYHIGLTKTLSSINAKYELKDKLTTEEKKRNNYDFIKFSDGYLYYQSTYESSLLLNGLKICPTDTYSITEIDNKNFYLELLDSFGGRLKSDGLDNFYDLFLDPMTERALKFYKLPTNYIDLLLYANGLLADNKFSKHTDVSSKRLRRYQIISVYVYHALADAYKTYSVQIKHSNRQASFLVKQSAVIDAFLTDSITSESSFNNALGEVETTNSVTSKGPNGLNADRAYSLDKRSYDSSMLNVLGMSTGFAGNAGITRQATINSNITADGYVKTVDGDTSKMNDSSSLTATESVVTFGSTHDDPMRTAMSFIQTAKHQVRTEESDPALITSGADEVMPYLTTDSFAFKAKDNGKVKEITEDYMIVEYNDGKCDYIDLKNNIQKNSDGGYYVPLKLDMAKNLKVGSQIKKNQILAYDKKSFSDEIGESNNIAFNVGKLAKIAILNTDEGFEDSGIISQKLAESLGTRVILKYDCVIDKDSTIFEIASVGAHIEASDRLLMWEDAIEDEESQELVKNLNYGDLDVSDLGKRKLICDVTGTLVGVKFYRTVELDELSPSLRKIVAAYEKPIKEMEKKLKENNINPAVLPSHTNLPPTGKLKKSQQAVFVEFYVEYFDTVGVGDKIVFFSANKAVEKNIFPVGKEPYTDFRPNEKIDAFVSEVAIDKRMVTSTLITGGINKAMIELDRSVKDILGIPYDDSKI